MRFYPKGEINPVLDGVDSSDDSWLNAGCIGIPDGPVIKENKFFDKICFGCDRDNLYLRFYTSKNVGEDILDSFHFLLA